AVPAVLFGLGGGYLDKYLHTSPLFLLAGLLIACITSFAIIGRKVRMILKRMPKDLPRKKKVAVDPVIAREQEELHDLFRPPVESAPSKYHWRPKRSARSARSPSA